MQSMSDNHYWVLPVCGVMIITGAWYAFREHRNPSEIIAEEHDQRIRDQAWRRLREQAWKKADSDKDSITTEKEWRAVYQKLGIYCDEFSPLELSTSDLERFLATK